MAASTTTDSITAADYIASQLQLESDAREVLPYAFDTCTRPLGFLRQPVYACRTCAPASPQPAPAFGASKALGAAALCYSCSIACHGDHELVEIFEKRDVACDCGSVRLPGVRCSLRKEADVPVVVKAGRRANVYGQNYWGRFCACEMLYEPEKEKGTMFQCLLGDACGEDWFHDVCVVGMGPPVYEQEEQEAKMEAEESNNDAPAEAAKTTGEDSAEAEKESSSVPAEPPHPVLNGTAPKSPCAAETATQAPASAAVPETTNGTQQQQEAERDNDNDENKENENEDEDEDEDGPPPPPGFPTAEFEHFICWACVEKNPWLKRYAGTPGFLPGVPNKPLHAPQKPAEHPHTQQEQPEEEQGQEQPAAVVPAASNTEAATTAAETGNGESPAADTDSQSRKRKATSPPPSDTDADAPSTKRLKTPPPPTTPPAPTTTTTSTSPPSAPACKLPSLPPPIPPLSSTPISLFLRSGFRSHLCHCAACFPLLAPHKCLLEEEESYSPPEDADAASEAASLLDSGEAALTGMDRVRAIEGVRAYNVMKEKVKAFLRPFAERGEAVAEGDISRFFEELKG